MREELGKSIDLCSKSRRGAPLTAWQSQHISAALLSVLGACHPTLKQQDKEKCEILLFMSSPTKMKESQRKIGQRNFHSMKQETESHWCVGVTD
jgi:hypothetical protein